MKILMLLGLMTHLAIAGVDMGNEQVQPFQDDPSLYDDSKKLAERFAPLVFFHSGEKYFPCSIEFFLKNSRLVRVDEREKEYGIGPIKPISRAAKVTQIIPMGQVYIDDLMHNNVDVMALDLMGNRQAYAGMPLRQDGSSPAPVYSKVVFTNPGKAHIQYWFNYTYNGPFAPIALGGRGPLGIHEGDWEHIVVTVQKVGSDWKIMDIYFSRHGRERGELVQIYGNQKPIVDFYEYEHPIIYSAKYGHASYPQVYGLRPTSDGDLVDKGNTSWRTWEKVVMIDNNTPWVNWKGRWGLAGDLGPKGLYDKPTWDNHYKSDVIPGTDIQKASNGKLIDVKVYEAGENFGLLDQDPKTRAKFSFDFSTHFKEICFMLEVFDFQTQKWGNSNEPFDVRKSGLFGTKTLYRVNKGSQCFKPKENAAKNYFIVPDQNLNPYGENYRLAIRGLNP